MTSPDSNTRPVQHTHRAHPRPVQHTHRAHPHPQPSIHTRIPLSTPSPPKPIRAPFHPPSLVSVSISFPIPHFVLPFILFSSPFSFSLSLPPSPPFRLPPSAFQSHHPRCCTTTLLLPSLPSLPSPPSHSIPFRPGPDGVVYMTWVYVSRVVLSILFVLLASLVRCCEFLSVVLLCVRECFVAVVPE
ncbi:hypothetical protein K439DRAFT_307689 [Ramaria rubella]|nr:hypothetical protein K439DRAFT_307689 [Ramaria rubella]